MGLGGGRRYSGAGVTFAARSGISAAHSMIHKLKTESVFHSAERENKAMRRKSHNSGACEGQRGRAGHYIRHAGRENYYDDEGMLLYQWIPRGKIVENAECVKDPDWFSFRAVHSTGWKEHKCRHQWEHGVREKEKHEKNRRRRALHSGDNFFSTRCMAHYRYSNNQQIKEMYTY